MADEIEVKADVEALIARASAGDREAARAVRRHYRDDPAGFRRLYQTLDRAAIHNLMSGTLPAGNEVMPLVIRAQVDELRRSLAGASPSPIESLLVDRIAVCWVDCNLADSLTGAAGLDASVARLEALSRRQSRANDRFLRAVKALAYVRRVGLNVLLMKVEAGASVVNAIGGRADGIS